MDETIPSTDLRMEVEDLHREEIFTDLRIGTIRRLTPVRPDGSDDPARPVRYVGQTQIWTQLGPMPISCDIEAASLADAVNAFPEAAQVAIERTIEEVKEMRREQASRIVVPEIGAGGPGPGRGKIQL
jgi:hypothetical protein